MNNSILLVDFINHEGEADLAASESARRAVRARFSAIFLTTTTTAEGLLPILTETSLQAQNLIPLAALCQS